MALLSFKEVSFSYNGVPVIKRFSFSAGEGTKVGIRGESGAGKSTLFRLILGFERPDSGEILFNSRHIGQDAFSSIRENSAWLPQDLNIGSGTVEEVVGRPFEFRLNRDLKPETENIVQVLESLGLPESIIQKPYRDLSSGQRQRVGVALCHLLNRKLYLLDEPTSALDRASAGKAMDLLLSVPGRTIISTSHDPFWLDQCQQVYSLD